MSVGRIGSASGAHRCHKTMAKHRPAINQSNARSVPISCVQMSMMSIISSVENESCNSKITVCEWHLFGHKQMATKHIFIEHPMLGSQTQASHGGWAWERCRRKVRDLLYPAHAESVGVILAVLPVNGLPSLDRGCNSVWCWPNCSCCVRQALLYLSHLIIWLVVHDSTQQFCSRSCALPCNRIRAAEKKFGQIH